MTTRLEIILEINNQRFYLDTNGIDTVPLTFNIANIKDISTTNGSFSKSIVIPETRNNRDVFNNISDLNSQSDFNPNKRSRAYILVDSQMVIEGYFQLTDVSLDMNYDKNTLTLVIFTDNNDFYTVLGEEYIETLDLSRFDHIWNVANIVKSWTQSYSYGYFYPLIDYGYDWTIKSINGSQHVASAPKSGLVAASQMYPAIYSRVIWDQIFTEAGFSWTSNSLINETPFDDLIIPFNNIKPGISNALFDITLMRVGITSQQVIKTTEPYVFPGGAGSTPPVFPGAVSGPTTWPVYYSPNPGYGGITGQLPTTERIKFNDETTPPNEDPNNLWNSTLFQYENTTGFPVNQRFGFNLTIKQLFYYSDNNRPSLQLYRSQNPTTGATVPGGYPVNTCETWTTSTNYPVDYTNGSGWTRTVPSIWGKYNNYETVVASFYCQGFQVFPGEKVWLEYTYHQSGAGDYDYAEDVQDYWSNPGGQPIWILTSDPGYPYTTGGLTVSMIQTTSYIYNEVFDAASVGMPIAMNSCIPKKIKKKDFILSIIKMFNLVVEPNKDFPNTLNIETRDYYYRTGAIKDWSKKIDLNDNIEIQILGETQNKRTKLKYKDDTDFFNADYTQKTGLSYGEYQYVTENEFSDGEKKLEIIFSPTPDVGIGELLNVEGATQSAMIIPKIGKVNNNQFQYSASNIRILQRKYLPLPTSDKWILDTMGNTQSSFPYAGHTDNPYNPTFDINFGQTEGLYYPQTTVTNNNLFTRYWKKMMDEISDRDSRIITCSMYLTPYDIINFRFNDNIYIDFGQGGQYYKVNKIENYDPAKIVTCKVELIKSKEITVPRAKISRGKPVANVRPLLLKPTIGYIRNNIVFDSNVQVLGENNSSVRSSTILGNSNNSIGVGNVIAGDDNNISSQKSSVTGDSNVILTGSNNSIVMGSNNYIEQGILNSKILGNNNTIYTEVGSELTSNVIILGDGMSVSTSNTINIAGVLVVNNNYINAGFDEVLNPFSDNSIINWIDGSRDCVRDYGSQTNIMLISGGRDKVI